MVRLLLLTILVFLPAMTFAQGKIRYTYDAAGNRVRQEAAVTSRKAARRTAALPDGKPASPALSQGHSVTACPYPTDGILKVSVSGIDGNTTYTLSVCTPQGTLILSREVKTDNVEIDLGNQPDGIYLLTVTIDDTPTTCKIIKRQ